MAAGCLMSVCWYSMDLLRLSAAHKLASSQSVISKHARRAQHGHSDFSAPRLSKPAKLWDADLPRATRASTYPRNGLRWCLGFDLVAASRSTRPRCHAALANLGGAALVVVLATRARRSSPRAGGVEICGRRGAPRVRILDLLRRLGSLLAQRAGDSRASSVAFALAASGAMRFAGLWPIP